jgi:hypothetical protein
MPVVNKSKGQLAVPTFELAHRLSVLALLFETAVVSFLLSFLFETQRGTSVSGASG